MPAATVRAQAKINLFLRVVGREATGYHHIETLFCRIGLADSVGVSLTSGTRALDCTGPEIPGEGLGPIENNLAWRAATAYSERAGWPAGFEIALEKHIPVRAGLGGGSADAGAVLRALNALNPRPLDQPTLEDIAASLGADVVFLTQDESPVALARARGDVYTVLAPLDAKPCIIAMPRDGIVTRDAYAWIDETRAWMGREVPAPATGFRVPVPLTWDDVAKVAHNDFEDVVFPRHPRIAATADWLQHVPLHRSPTRIVLMSGSGSAIFGIPLGRRVERVLLPPPPSDVRAIVSETAERVESVRLID